MTAPSSTVHAIDLGTSASSIVVGHPDGRTIPVRDPASPHGNRAVRSSVCVLADGSLVVGTAADRAARTRPGTYRTQFKADFGDPTAARLGDRVLRTDELVREVITFLRAQALRTVPREPDLVSVTVPASWESGKRDLMLRTVADAGYPGEAVHLRDEPVAAAAYAVGEIREPGALALVYDLGGGTFDCAVARAGDGGRFEVLGRPAGLGDVGGGAFDRRVLADLRARTPGQAAELFDPDRGADADVVRRRIALRERCEQMKVDLSVATVVTDYVVEFRPPVEHELTRATLDELIRPLVERTLHECERLLGTVDLSWEDLELVVPVGGSSRLALVGAMLQERSGRPVAVVEDPDLAVVRGAARLATEEAWPAPSPPAEAPSTSEPDPTSEPVLPDPTPGPYRVRRFDPDRDIYNEE